MATIARHSGIEVFALSEAMLSRAVELSTINLDLKPFDQADDVVFCELDGDLQPWDKNGRAKQPLTDLYDSAHLWVYGDFAMQSPVKRSTFPE
jgi:hypothetical protein